MRAKSKALWFISLPALLLALLVLTAGPGEAVISKDEEKVCDILNEGCENQCYDKARECGKDSDRCLKDCQTICDYKRSDYLTKADKDAPCRTPLQQLADMT
jgi:hypothetical protein